MKIPYINRDFLSSYILITAAAFLLLVVAITDRRDITSASVVISAMILFLCGIFLFTFSKKESIDDHISSLIPVQNQINFCTIISELGIMGNSWILPQNKTGKNCVMQFTPVSTYSGGTLQGDIFVSGEEGTGILVQPTGQTLISYLRKNAGLTIPDSEEEILQLIKETGEELLEIAEKINIQKTGEGISINLDNYLLIDGCRRITAESPACCTLNPCSICSLFGMIITEGLNQAVMVERCRPDKKKDRVEILFTIS